MHVWGGLTLLMPHSWQESGSCHNGSVDAGDGDGGGPLLGTGHWCPPIRFCYFQCLNDTEKNDFNYTTNFKKLQLHVKMTYTDDSHKESATS